MRDLIALLCEVGLQPTPQRLAVAPGKDLGEGRFYLCPVCGHIELGAPPASCPICGAKAEKFVQL